MTLSSTFVVALIASSAGAVHPQTVFDQATRNQLRNSRDDTSNQYHFLASNLRRYLEERSGGVSRLNIAGYAIAANIIDELPFYATAIDSLVHHCRADWSYDLDLEESFGLVSAAIGYDVLYDSLEERQQTDCRNRIALHANHLAEAANHGIWWVPDMVQNHNWVNFSAIGLAAQALEGDWNGNEVTAWQDLARQNFQKIKAIQDLVTDGSWHEGIGYMEFGLTFQYLYSLGAVRRGINDDLTNMLSKIGTYIFHAQVPNHPRIHVMTHGDWNWSRPGLLVALRWASRRFHDRFAQEAARRWDLEPRLRWDDFGFYYAIEYIMYDPSVPNLDVNNVPLDYYAEDQQSTIMRSSWDVGPNSDALILGFKTGVFGGRGNYERLKVGGYPGGSLNFSHDHEDDLQLTIYGKGGWLLPEAVAYNCCNPGTDYHSSTWHNTFLIDGDGELGDDKNLNYNFFEYGRPHPWFVDREASMPMHLSTDHYAFSRGDGSRLYPSNLGVRLLSRTIAMARENGGYFVLQDRMILDTARTIQQIFHSQVSISDTPPWIKLRNLNNLDLGIRVVAPTGYATDIRTVPSNNYYGINDRGIFALGTIRPPTPQSNVVFLEFLWPSRDSDWGSRPNVQPLESGAPHRGLFAQLGRSDEFWIYNLAGSITYAGDLAIQGTSDGDIGIKRVNHGTQEIERIVLVGSGKLLDQFGARTLLDIGSNVGSLEVAIEGTRADLSGSSAIDGISFYGPAVTEVYYQGSPVQFTVDNNGMVTPIAGLLRAGKVR